MPATVFDHLAGNLGATWTAPPPGACQLTREGAWTAMLDINESSCEVSMRSIHLEPKGTGIGSQIMRMLKVYCELTGKELQIVEIDNVAFFQRFDWLAVFEPDEDFDETQGQAFYQPGM